MRHGVVIVAVAGMVFLFVDHCNAQPGKENPYKKAHDELSKLKGISGLGATTATSVVHEINFGRPGQDNDQVMRDVMKHRYGLGGLRLLRVPSAGLTDAGAREIKGLPALERLNLEQNRITDAGLA